MRRGKSVFWGTVLLLGAAALIMGRLGYLEGIGFWSILFSACLISFLVKGIARLRIGTILFSLAFLIIVNDELLHLEAITPWPVLGAALLGTVGLKILFPGLGRYRRWNRGLRAGNGERGAELVCLDGKNSVADFCDRDGKSLSYDNIMGQSVKYVTGVISHVAIDNIFGALDVYFTDAQLSRGSAFVSVDNIMGEVVLYVPRAWQVEMNVENILGSSTQQGERFGDGVNVFHVVGDVIMGQLQVIQI